MNSAATGDGDAPRTTRESREICDAVRARVVDEWQVIGWYGVCAKGGSAAIANAERWGPAPKAVVEYIAHFDPRSVSGMLDDMDRLARLREGLEKLLGDPNEYLGSWGSHRAVLCEDIRALLDGEG
jgi:hypothetical protein